MSFKLSKNGLELITAGLIDIYAPKTVMGYPVRGSHFVLMDSMDPIRISSSSVVDIIELENGIYQQPYQIDVGDTFYWRCEGSGYPCTFQFLDGYYIWGYDFTNGTEAGDKTIGDYSTGLTLVSAAVPYESIKLSTSTAPVLLHCFVYGIRIK